MQLWVNGSDPLHVKYELTTASRWSPTWKAYCHGFDSHKIRIARVLISIGIGAQSTFFGGGGNFLSENMCIKKLKFPNITIFAGNFFPEF